ncbi:MAG: SpoVA/SpoVAEb family sporulation membrane protein [Clostridiales bacterium]|nr:SpoVA/SpoVAEb family sporulation membrane protein [Clostridiales bacterium]
MKSDMHNQKYDELVKKMTPNSRMLRGYVRAFWVGGTICCIGQALNLLGNALELTVMTSPMFTSMVLIFIGTTLTGFGVYDRIGRYAGAGSIVPITGFANSIAASAIEFRREGLILGLGSRLFAVAGPVLAYGISSSILAGLIHWGLGRIG